MARTTAKAKDTGKDKKPLGKKKTKSDSSSISDAEKRADAKQAERDNRAGERYLEQARNLNPQARALIKSLEEMKQRRRQDIRDITRNRATTLEMLTSSADEMGIEYDTAAENNEIAASGTLEAGMSNAVRERAETLTQLLAQGAGESDSMRAMLMAARNQNANARDANQSYWDTIASINQNIVSMNEDTQAKLADAWIKGEGEKEQIWRDYLESSADASTQLGLVRQSQADAIANAKEYKVSAGRLGKTKDSKGVGKNLKKWESKGKGPGKSLGKVGGSIKDASRKDKGVPAGEFRRRQAKEAFMDWAELQDESYRQKNVPEWIKGYKGKAKFEGVSSNSNLGAAITVEPVGKAEGATLRKWAS